MNEELVAEQIEISVEAEVIGFFGENVCCVPTWPNYYNMCVRRVLLQVLLYKE